MNTVAFRLGNGVAAAEMCLPSRTQVVTNSSIDVNTVPGHWVFNRAERQRVPVAGETS